VCEEEVRNFRIFGFFFAFFAIRSFQEKKKIKKHKTTTTQKLCVVTLKKNCASFLSLCL